MGWRGVFGMCNVMWGDVVFLVFVVCVVWYGVVWCGMVWLICVYLAVYVAFTAMLGQVKSGQTQSAKAAPVFEKAVWVEFMSLFVCCAEVLSSWLLREFTVVLAGTDRTGKERKGKERGG